MGNAASARLIAIEPNLQGINLRALARLWVQLGGTYRPGRRNGEIYFQHARFKRNYRCGRSKGSPRELVRRLRILIRDACDSGCDTSREAGAHSYDGRV